MELQSSIRWLEVSDQPPEPNRTNIFGPHYGIWTHSMGVSLNLEKKKKWPLNGEVDIMCMDVLEEMEHKNRNKLKFLLEEFVKLKHMLKPFIGIIYHKYEVKMDL